MESLEQEAEALTGQGEATTMSQPPPTDQVHPGTTGEQSRSSPERASHDSDKMTPLASASTQSTSCHIKTPCTLAGHSPWIKTHMLPWQNSGQQRREQAAQVSGQKNPPSFPNALETPFPQQFGAELQASYSSDCRSWQIWIPLTEKLSPFMQLHHLEHTDFYCESHHHGNTPFLRQLRYPQRQAQSVAGPHITHVRGEFSRAEWSAAGGLKPTNHAELVLINNVLAFCGQQQQQPQQPPQQVAAWRRAAQVD